MCSLFLSLSSCHLSTAKTLQPTSTAAWLCVIKLSNRRFSFRKVIPTQSSISYLQHQCSDSMGSFHIESTESVGFLHMVIYFLLGLSANVYFMFTVILTFTLLIFSFPPFSQSLLIKISRGRGCSMWVCRCQRMKQTKIWSEACCSYSEVTAMLRPGHSNIFHHKWMSAGPVCASLYSTSICQNLYVCKNSDARREKFIFDSQLRGRGA